MEDFARNNLVRVDESAKAVSVAHGVTNLAAPRVNHHPAHFSRLVGRLSQIICRGKEAALSRHSITFNGAELRGSDLVRLLVEEHVAVPLHGLNPDAKHLLESHVALRVTGASPVRPIVRCRLIPIRITREELHLRRRVNAVVREAFKDRTRHGEILAEVPRLAHQGFAGSVVQIGILRDEARAAKLAKARGLAALPLARQHLHADARMGILRELASREREDLPRNLCGGTNAGQEIHEADEKSAKVRSTSVPARMRCASAIQNKSI